MPRHHSGTVPCWTGTTVAGYSSRVSHTSDLAEHFLELHREGEPLLLANVWDAGSARLLESLGYAALATTSSGHAGTLGRQDGGVPRDVVLNHCREIGSSS